MQPVVVFAFYLLLAGSSQTAPGQAGGSCSPRCTGHKNKFKLTPGTSYAYKYESETKVQLVGTSKNVAKVGLKATATITAGENCGFFLSLTGVKFDGPNPALVGFDLAKDLEKFPLAFAYDNGAVYGVCPNQDETDDALNIKKAILSTYQVANDFDNEEVYETDIGGHCPTKQKSQGSGDSITLTKNKILRQCRNHFSNYSSVRAVPYSVPSLIQNVPIFESNQECKFKIQKQVLQTASCTETHVYWAARNLKSGAGITATITGSLTFDKEGKASPPAGTIGKLQPLFFDEKSIIWRESKAGLVKAKESLNTMCKTSQEDVRPESPKHFVELVYNLKATTTDDLRSLAKEVKAKKFSCEKAQNFFVDAVIQCGTAPCVTLLTELLTPKANPDLPALSYVEQRLAMANLLLTAHPTRAMVAAVTKVVGDLPPNGLFGATALVNNYCRLHPECLEKEEVKAFVQKYIGLVSKLTVSENPRANAKVIETLRAYGNLGYLADGVKERLKYLEQKNAHIDVRLAAVQSLRRSPCIPDLKNKLLAIFSDSNEDVEVRAQVFFVLMSQCVDKELVSQVANITSAANSNQIGSLVQSYFNGMRSSADPGKDKNLWSVGRLSKKFPSDPRKHSRFYEFSKFSYKYNSGYHVDGSVIYTPKDAYPKQARLNLTVDYFGNEINLVEFGFRADKFDKLIDDLFGPEGHFTNPGGAYDREGRKTEVKQPKLKEFQNLYDQQNKPAKGLDFGSYIRVFGDEVIHASDYDIPVMDRYSRMLFNPLTTITLLGKEQTVNLVANRLPYDHHVTIPVISGFPFRISLNVSLLLNLQLGGKLDMARIQQGSAEAKLTLKPSAGLDASGLFAIYTGNVKNGVGFSRVSHTSTAFTLDTMLKDYRELKISLELPKERQDVFSINHRIYTYVNDVPVEEQGVAVDNRVKASLCTRQSRAETIGLRLCGGFSFPNGSSLPDGPNFPLTGPFNAELYIEKADPSLKSYEFVGSWKPNKNGHDVTVSFDTPQSKVNRKRSLTVNYERQKSLNLEYNSPSTKVKGVGVLEAAGPDKTTASITLNRNAEVYEIKGTMSKTSLPNNGRKYAFIGNAKSQNKPVPGDLTGNLEILPGRKFLIDGEVTKLFDKPLNFKINLDKGPSDYTAEAGYQGFNSARRFKVETKTKTPTNASLTMSYETSKADDKSAPKKWSLDHYHDIKLSGSSYRAAAGGAFTHSLAPQSAFGYDVSVDRKPEKLQISANCLCGGKPGLSFEQTSITKKNDYSTTALFKYPSSKINYKGEVTYKALPRNVDASLKLFDLENKKDAQAIIKYKMTDKEGDGLVLFKTFDKEYKITKNFKTTGDKSYKSDTLIQWAPDRKVEIASTLTGSYEDFSVTADVTLPDKQKYQVSETYKMPRASGAALWTNVLKKDGKIVWDWNVEGKTEGKKRNLKAHLKLPGQEFDRSVDGTFEPLADSSRVSIASKRNNKDYSKVEIVAPKQMTLKKLESGKLNVVWGLDSPKSKEIGIECKSGKAEQEFHVKMDVPEANYQLEIKRRGDDVKITNITILKTNAPIVKLSVGRGSSSGKHSSGRQIVSRDLDVQLATFRPMEPRDLSGRLKIANAQGGGAAAGDLFYLVDLDLQDRTGKHSFGFDAELGSVRDGQLTGYDKMVKFDLDGQAIEFKNKALRNPQDYMTMNVKGQASLSGDKAGKGAKKFSWDVDCNPKKSKAVFETPYPAYPKIELNKETNIEGKKKTTKFDASWSKNKISGEAVAEKDTSLTKYDVSVKSTYDALKSFKYQMKKDTRKGLDHDLVLNLNDVHKLESHTKQASEPNGDFSASNGLTCKLGGLVDFDAKVAGKYAKSSGKYDTKNSFRFGSGPAHKFDVELDTKTMNVKIDSENVPGLKGPVKGQAKKVGEDEYEIALSDASGPNKGLMAFKFTSPSQKLRLETPEFKTNYESEYTDKKLSAAWGYSPDAKAADKNYNLKFASDKPNPNTKQFDLNLGYPGRTMTFKSKRANLPNNHYDQEFAFNPNEGKRKPTVLAYKVDKTPDQPISGEMHVTDPNLPDGLHLASKYTRTGAQQDPTKDSVRASEFSFKYSKDPKKELKFKKESKRQILQNRPKISTMVELDHESSNLKHALWNSYLIGGCAPGSPDCEYNFALGTKYPDDKKQVQEYSVDVKRSQKSFDAEVGVSKSKYKLVKKHVKGQNTYEVAKDGKSLYDVVTEFIHKNRQPLAALRLLKKPINDVIFSAVGSLPSDNLASFQVYHDEKGQLVKDVEATANLKESDRLRLKFSKRTGLTEALTNIFNSLIPKKGPEIEDLPQVAKAQAIGTDILQQLKPMLAAWDKEEDEISKELKVTSQGIGKTLQNEVQTATEFFNYILDLYDANTAAVGSAAANLAKSTKATFKNLATTAAEATSEAGKGLRTITSRAGNAIRDTNDKVQKAVDGVYKSSGMDEVGSKVVKIVREVAKGKTMVERIKILFEKFVKALGVDPKGATDKVSSLKLGDYWREPVKQAIGAWEQIRVEWSKNEEYKDAVKFFDLLKSKAQWAVDYVDPQKQLKDAYAAVTTDLVTPKRRMFEYNKTDDGYVVEMDLPAQYNSLDDLVTSMSPDRVIASIDAAKQSIEDLLDGIYSGGEATGPVLGTGKSKAVIVGEQTYITFDGQWRTITSDCTYLLARDFKDSKFSVSVEVERGVRKNIIIEYDKNKIEIGYDGKVSVDGKKTELPWDAEIDSRGVATVQVFKHDEYFTTLQTFDGLTIECNSFNNICAVILKARFKGKTNGVLGRNDGESYSDMSLPDGAQAANYDAYLSGWAVNPSCARARQAAPPAAGKEDAAHAEKCTQLLRSLAGRRAVAVKGSSACAALDAEQFNEACARELRRAGADPAKQDKAACAVASALSTACPGLNDLPAQCIQCDIPGGKLSINENKKIDDEKLLKDVDVVFIVENLQCMSAVKSKLGPLAQKIETSMKQKGLDVKFGLAGFNGEGSRNQPHFFTSQQSLVSFSSGALKSASDKLKFWETYPKIGNNPLDVLDFVIDHYSFRTGSRKLLVLFACTNCVTLELDYYKLHDKFFGQNYAMHLVTAQKIELGTDSKDNFIGFDGSAFIKPDMKKNEEARKNLVEPHDSCTVLAQETNGTVYSLAQKENLNPIFDSLAVNLVETAGGNKCTVCECDVHDLYPKATCFPCEVPQPAAMAADKTGFFNNPFQKLAKLQKKP